MTIRLLNLGEGPILAGSLTGRKVLGQLIEGLGDDPAEPESVYIDFAGIEVATASFLREAVLEFCHTVRARRRRFYPIVANANITVTEELAILMTRTRSVLLHCLLDSSGNAGALQLLGNLEPKQQITLDLVRKKGETDAKELLRSYHESHRVSHTAWNNRLAALARLGIIVELNEGRSKRYRPLMHQ